MADLVTRTEWGARAPHGSYSTLMSTRGVKVHYTGGRVDPKMLDDHDRCIGAVKSFQNFHMDGNGWIDLGYTCVACWHRKVFVGRGLHHLPAANGPGLNSGHYAVLALVGNAGLVEPTDELLLAIWDAIDWLRANGGAGKEIKGHRDGYSTDCPGDPLYSWIRKGAPRPRGGTRPADVDAKPVTGHTPRWPGRLLTYPPLTVGDDVEDWQRQMERRGWDITVDGQYGPQSADVCRRFQAEKGLAVDGIVGARTWRAAFEAPIT
ncbi:N-acetylmuramoyl-L-alanine amidase [Microbispora sp. KK1-11]|uniref:peptidoglycan recognition protein family protein n=1 Tax=Microbispora sp. KK1-11 TaxID=2053005 RepID=UPI00115AA71E|nr:N-acetylmuramoyl-L-alanine amidase [Microbispora sp. KK1-11]TQS29118.1 N-acetylmuramoyl-L-alanine amidase [Microbispora sp. KK1-11]